MTNNQKRQKRILRKAGLVALVVVFGFSIVSLHLPCIFAEEKAQLSAEQINENFEKISKAGGYFKASYICTLLSAGAMVIGLFSESEEGTIGAILVGGGLSVASIVYQWLAANNLSSVLTPELAFEKRFREALHTAMAGSREQFRKNYKMPLKLSYSIQGGVIRLLVLSERASLKDAEVDGLKKELMSLAHQVAKLCQDFGRSYNFTLGILDASWKMERFQTSLSFDETLGLQVK